MKLILKVITKTGVEVNTLTLNQESITIGRNNSNTLVLEDPQKYISGQHAIIEYRNPDYFVTDTSTNGVLINNTAQPVGNGNSTKLNDGDQLYMGDYRVEVEFIKDQQTTDATVESVTSETNKVFDFFDDPFAELDTDSVQEMIDDDQWKPSSGLKDTPSISESFNSPEQDFFDSEQKDANHRQEVDQPSPFNEAFPSYVAKKKEKKETSSNNIFDEDWFTKDSKNSDEPEIKLPKQLVEESILAEKPVDHNPLLKTEDLFGGDWLTKGAAKTIPPEIGSVKQQNLIDTPKIEVVEQLTDDKSFHIKKHEKPPNEADNQSSLLVNNFLKGVGFDNTEISKSLSLSPENFYIIGKILRSSIQGAMDILDGRAKIKNEMHLDVTMIRPLENNPVKFSVSVEEAIKKLLAPQDTGYLPAEEAIEEIFNDIRAHQFSVIAGMQTALLDVLKRFNPQKLEQRFQQQNPISSSIPIHKQAKLWDAFEQLYNDIEHEAADNFYHLFGQAFAETYERQMLELKNSKKDNPF